MVNQNSLHRFANTKLSTMQTLEKIRKVIGLLDKANIGYTHISLGKFFSGEIIFGLNEISISYDEENIAIWDGIDLVREDGAELSPKDIYNLVTNLTNV